MRHKEFIKIYNDSFFIVFYTVLNIVKNRSIAEEITTEVFIKFSHSQIVIGNPKLFLFLTTRIACCDYLYNINKKATVNEINTILNQSIKLARIKAEVINKYSNTNNLN